MTVVVACNVLPLPPCVIHLDEWFMLLYMSADQSIWKKKKKITNHSIPSVYYSHIHTCDIRIKSVCYRIRKVNCIRLGLRCYFCYTFNWICRSFTASKRRWIVIEIARMQIRIGNSNNDQTFSIIRRMHEISCAGMCLQNFAWPKSKRPTKCLPFFQTYWFHFGCLDGWQYIFEPKQFQVRSTQL